jgi:hypothetical protein
MKHPYLLALIGICSYSFGQQSVTSSGGDIQSSQGSVSYSIGQVGTNWISNGGNMNEGVQQPYEFFQVLSIDKPKLLLSLEVFPNPTSGIIYLKSKDAVNATIEVIDETGRLVWKNEWKNILQETIDLTAYSRGVYTIKIAENSFLQSIKIIKN